MQAMAKPAPKLTFASESSTRPLVMGIVNVTPDSFYPGSRVPRPEDAIAHGLKLAQEGADILDVGGQSTRPGSDPVALDEELKRVVPVVAALAAQTGLPVSIDTDKAQVAWRCREAGASILNDVSAFRADPAMLGAALEFQAVVVMHRGGQSPKTMQDAPSYRDVVAEVTRFFEERGGAFVREGGDLSRLVYDPGIGFGKDLDHNLSLLKHLDSFRKLGPVLLGASRKAFLGKLAGGAGPEERLEGSLAAACWAAFSGASIVRVHDVAATRRALDVIAAVRGAQ